MLKTERQYASLAGIPIIGRLFHVFSGNAFMNNIISAGKVAEKNQYGRCLFKIFGKRFYLLTREEDLRQVEVLNHEKISRWRVFNHSKESGIECIAGNFMGLKKDESWKLKRESVKQFAFNNEGFLKLADKTETVVSEIINHLLANQKNSLSLSTMTEYIAINGMGKIILGMHNLPEKTNEIKHHIHEVATELFNPENQIRWQLPGLLRNIIFRKKENEIKKLRSHFDNKTCNLILKPNESWIKSGPSILTGLWEVENRLQNRNVPICEALYAESNLALVAAYDTLSTTMQFIIKLIEAHPTIREKLLDEINRSCSQSIPDVAMINEMKYLDMIIAETLRLYSPIFIIAKGIDQSFVLIDAPAATSPEAYTKMLENDRLIQAGLKLEIGDIVISSPYITQRRSDYYDNPLTFDPERFSNMRSDKIVSGRYFPFGMGDQLCLGRKFSIQFIKLVLTAIYKNFKIELIGDNRFDLKYEGGVIKPRYGLQIKMTC